MGTVTPFPAAIPPEILDLTASDLRANMAELTESMTLDTLRAVPDCVGLILRREVGGRWWDITLGCNYYQSKEDGAQLVFYVWDATETAIGLDDDALPEEIMGHDSYESPEEALAAALDALAREDV